jgi:hypothetical protein
MTRIQVGSRVRLLVAGWGDIDDVETTAELDKAAARPAH